MAINWALYESKLTINGATSREDYINDFINSVNNDFDLSLSHFEVLINNVTTDVQIVDDAAESNEKLNSTKVIIMKPSEIISIGDLVYWNSEYWLCTGVEVFSDTYYKGIITKCNNILKFYNPSLVLKQVNCIVGTRNLKSSENMFYSLPDNQFIVVVSDNTDATTIGMGSRFILNGQAYKVITDPDGISSVGLKSFKIESTSIIDDDNLSLGITDYYSKQSTYELNIMNGTSINMYYAESTLQLDIEAKKNGVVVTSPILTCVSSNVNVATVSATGLITAHGTGDATITVTYQGLTDTIVVHGNMTAIDGYSVMITPLDTTIKVTTSTTFTATPMNNGVEDALKEVTWSIRNVDGSSNIYASIVPNGKTCVLTVNSFTGKYIILRAELNFDNSYYKEVQIKTVNLF